MKAMIEVTMKMIKNKKNTIYIITLVVLFGISYSFFNKKDDKKKEILTNLKFEI